MKPNLPLVTIITPAYNRASYLDETILSVLGQDYPNTEYIVLDDGSTDNTLDIIKKYNGKIIWDSHPNMGETRTVNKGFSMAKGDIIGVVNSDDPLLKTAISKIVTFMISNPEIVVTYPDWNLINEKGEVIHHYDTYVYAYITMLRLHHCMPGPGAFFRRKIIEQLGGRDPQFRYVGDFDFWLRAGLIGPFARIEETLATFRRHPDSASLAQQGALMGEEHIVLVKKIYSLPNLPSAVKKVKREAYGNAYYIAGEVCGDNLDLKKYYYRKALLRAGDKFLLKYHDRLARMLSVLLGRFYVITLPLRRMIKIIIKGSVKCI